MQGHKVAFNQSFKVKNKKKLYIFKDFLCIGMLIGLRHEEAKKYVKTALSIIFLL